MREFTVKDLAELLGVSKPTIQRAINAAAIEADREDGQKSLILTFRRVSVALKHRQMFRHRPKHRKISPKTPPQHRQMFRHRPKHRHKRTVWSLCVLCLQLSKSN